MKPAIAGGLALVLLVGIIGCSATAQRAMVSPVAQPTAIDAMVAVMVDQGYVVKNIDKANGLIVAEKAPGWAKVDKTPYQASVVAVAEGEKTRLSITITRPGDSDSINQSEMVKELVKAFEAKTGSPVEVVPQAK